MTTRIAGFSLVLALFCTTADAHPPPFFWMPDISGESRAGADLMLGPNDLVGDAFVAAAGLFAEISLTKNLAVSARLPVAFASFDIGAGDESGFALGNLALGGQLANWEKARSDRSRTLYAFGVVLALPTASDSGDSGTAANIAALHFIPDSGRYRVDTTTIRARGDFRYEASPLFVQAELAFDFYLREGDDEIGALVGVGAGVKLNPNFAALAEITTVSDIIEDSDDENFVHTVDVGLRWHNQSVVLGARVYVPVDESLRDASVLGFGLDAAARF